MLGKLLKYMNSMPITTLQKVGRLFCAKKEHWQMSVGVAK